MLGHKTFRHQSKRYHRGANVFFVELSSLKKLVGEKILRDRNKYYYIEKKLFNHRLGKKIQDHKRCFKKHPIVVYQMGKVGSMTVVNSLQKLKLDRLVFHVHYLDQDRINELGLSCKNDWWYKSKNSEHFETMVRKHWECEYLASLIKGPILGDKWRIISLVRDPIARNASVYFQGLTFDHVNKDLIKVKSGWNFERIIDLNDLTEFVNLFFEKVDHDRPLNFFDSEIKRVLGIDVFSRPFPKRKGYQIYNGKNCDLLLIKLENLNSCAERAFNEFLNLKDFSLVISNTSKERKTGFLYKKFLNSVEFPKSYLDKFYKSKFAEHFYTKEELKTFENRWANRKYCE